MKRSTLTLVESVYEPGRGQPGFPFLDFVVDGEPMTPVLRRKFDVVSTLWATDIGRTLLADKVATLFGTRPGDAPNGRVPVFVCSECGDLSCGAVTMRLTVTRDEVSWSDWGYQNDYDGEVERDALGDLPTFTFERNEYEAALMAALDRPDSDHRP